MNIRTILLTSVAAGALAVTVGACTHSGDDGIPQSQLDAETEAKEAAEKKAAEEQAAREQAEADAEAEKKRADDAQAKLDAQEAERDAANARALFMRLSTVAKATSSLNRSSQTTVNDTPTADMQPAKKDETKKGNAVSRIRLDGADVLVSTIIPNGEFDLTGLNDDNKRGEIKLSEFSRSTGQKAFNKGASFSGTALGVPGVYSCDAASSTDCTIAVAADDGSGKVKYTFAGAWTFRADNPNGMTASNNYLEFGWWKAAPEKGAAPTGVGVFVATEGFQPVSDVDGLAGTAKYSGEAVGKYALRDDAGHGTAISGDGTPVAGAFEAKASLTATFGASSTTLNGTIEDFVTDDGTMQDWTVALPSTSFSDGGFAGTAETATDSPGTMPVWTANEKAAAEAGQWHADFYRDVNAAPDLGVTDNTPTHVAGTFSTSYGSVGWMVGAFGAERD